MKTFEDLDRRRYVEYFENILQDTSIQDWQEMLINRSFLVGDNNPHLCSYFAYALFARQPGLRLPQAVARLTVYSGEDKDYDTVFDKTMDVPFLGFRGGGFGNDVVEPALDERLVELIKPYISKEKLYRSVRQREWDYPFAAIRELIINGCTHRDWTQNNYVRITAYSNRLEVISPGGLPNGMTIEKIKSGAQMLRNPKCARIFRDYGYLEDQSMGIRRKVIPLMLEKNGREPGFEATEDAFKVTLWKK